jgi:hypothetical protein
VAFGASNAPKASFASFGVATDTLRLVHWVFTGLLIGTSGATAVYTLWLLRRLFTTAPVPDAATVSVPEPKQPEKET